MYVETTNPSSSIVWVMFLVQISERLGCLEFFARTPGVIFSCLKKDHYVPLINTAWFAVEELGYSLLGNLLYLWMRKHETRLMCFLKSAARQACFHASRHDGFAGNPSLPERTCCPTVFMCRIAVSSLCPNLLEATCWPVPFFSLLNSGALPQTAPWHQCSDGCQV